MLSQKRFYSTIAIALFALVATPVAGGCMMAVNEKQWNNPQKARQAILLGIGVTLVFAALVFFFFLWLPVLLFPLFYGSIWYLFAEIKQGETLKKMPREKVVHFMPGVLLFALPGWIITAGLFFALQPEIAARPYRVATLHVGKTKHELRYHDLNKYEITTLLDALENSRHFGTQFSTYVNAGKAADTITLWFPVFAEEWNQVGWIAYSDTLKMNMNRLVKYPLKFMVFDHKNGKKIQASFRECSKTRTTTVP